ncbi:MAG: hypothetical protein ACSHYA_12655 [Opitutaceae bacterium]
MQKPKAILLNHSTNEYGKKKIEIVAVDSECEPDYMFPWPLLSVYTSEESGKPMISFDSEIGPIEISATQVKNAIEIIQKL